MTRQAEIFSELRLEARRTTDRMFLWLLLAQWVFAVALALILTPYTWNGTTRELHFHVKAAIGFGLLINTLPIALIAVRPGWWGTRHVVAVVQMLWSAMLIMITGGRIETHFHVFGSLAFLAFYRDWRVLVTATITVAADHLARGMVWPDSVYGIANPEWWRFLEHAAWVAFEDIVLAFGCVRSMREMAHVAEREAQLEATNGAIEGLVAERTHELQLDLTKQKELELELQQAQKLESVGRLAAGVAHEINTPVQYVSDSVTFVREGVGEMMGAVAMHRESTRLVLAGQPSTELARKAIAADDDVDLPYLFEQFPQALDRALEGLSRVAGIVRSMKIFAHPDGKDMSAVDLNAAVASTLTIARNEYKFVADVVTDLGALPPVTCHAGEINQVMLNIVVNAAHAIADRKGSSDQRGTINVSTRVDGDDAVISIGDTGMGIPDEVRHRVFEPFFTTKEVGRGAGQGLAIARSVVVDKHRGTLTFDTEAGRGTTFHIRIPVCPRSSSLAA